MFGIIFKQQKSRGGIAQLGERLNGIQEVSGSIPLISTKTNRTSFWMSCLFSRSAKRFRSPVERLDGVFTMILCMSLICCFTRGIISCNKWFEPVILIWSKKMTGDWEIKDVIWKEKLYFIETGGHDPWNGIMIIVNFAGENFQMQIDTGMRDIQQRTTTIGVVMRVLEILRQCLIGM